MHQCSLAKHRVLISLKVLEDRRSVMKTQTTLMRFLLCTAAATLCGEATSADIYRSEGQDGTVRFASEKLDASYRLYLRDDSPSGSSVSSKRNASALSSSLGKESRTAFIEKLSSKYGVDPVLVQAIIDVESKGSSTAVSTKGASGAMQLMPATAAMYGVTIPADPAQNIDAGIRHLKRLLALYDGNVALSLAAYNAGEGAVAKHAARIPPYRETMLYVPAVLARMQAARNQSTR
jgi:soluble lytic murein transglycosylase-like protein